MTTTTTTTTKPKARLLKFGSKTCGACIAMDKARVLERLQSEYPDVKVVKLDISDDDGESPAPKAMGDVDYKTNYKLSDDYEVTMLPTLVLEVENAGELGRIEGAASFKQLKELMGEYEFLCESIEQSAKIPWT
jgi:thiol-disulfide isomerase/thioredoxin